MVDKLLVQISKYDTIKHAFPEIKCKKFSSKFNLFKHVLEHNHIVFVSVQKNI